MSFHVHRPMHSYAYLYIYIFIYAYIFEEPWLLPQIACPEMQTQPNQGWTTCIAFSALGPERGHHPQRRDGALHCSVNAHQPKPDASLRSSSFRILMSWYFQDVGRQIDDWNENAKRLCLSGRSDMPQSAGSRIGDCHNMREQTSRLVSMAVRHRPPHGAGSGAAVWQLALPVKQRTTHRSWVLPCLRTLPDEDGWPTEQDEGATSGSWTVLDRCRVSWLFCWISRSWSSFGIGHFVEILFVDHFVDCANLLFESLQHDYKMIQNDTP